MQDKLYNCIQPQIQMKPKQAKKAEPKPRKDKAEKQRLRTFNSSEFSLWEDKNNMVSSATDLAIFKNQSIAKRRANNSSLSQYGQNAAASKPNTGKTVAKKKKKVNRQTKSRPKLVVEEYERAKYKDSNSNSEILFSNDETKRSSAIELKDKNIKPDIYLHQLNCRAAQNDANLILRVSIKREYVRKVQAAVKIQKVFRGYMTRKILMKYVVGEEFRLSNHGERPLSSFNSRRETSSIGSTFRECDDFSRIGIQNNSSRQKPPLDSDQQFQQMKREARELNRERSQPREEQSSSEEDDSEMVYRHQNPIYSQEQISDLLPSSGEESEEWNDAYEPDIIFETNEEYLQSRKSSLQNRNEPINRLSNKGIAEIMNLRKESRDRLRLNSEEAQGSVDKKQARSAIQATEQTQELGVFENEKTLKNAVQQFVIKKNEKTEKKNIYEVAQRIREESSQSQSYAGEKTLKSGDLSIRESFRKDEISEPKRSSEASVEEKVHNHQDQQVNVTRKMNLRLDPSDLNQYLEGSEPSSAKSDSSRSQSLVSKGFNSHRAEHQDIFQLREQECERWEEVIRMVSSQIRKNNEKNGEMLNFMKTIMQFSQKNKELLGNTDQHTTPTSVDTFFMQPNSNLQDTIEEPEEEVPPKFFKKKSLKIDLVEQVDHDSIFDPLRESSSFKKGKKKSPMAFSLHPESPPLQIFKQAELSSENIIIPHLKVKQARDQFASPSMIPRQDINPTKLKSFFSSGMQIQDEAINQILRLREELLQKRESEELMKLHGMLGRKQLNQTQFIERLELMTRKFSQQKTMIDKAKDDITKGYQAANELVKEYFYDVRRMGIKLAVSRSQDNLKYKVSPQLIHGSDLIIDQLTPKSTPNVIKGIFANHEIEDNSENSRRDEEEDSEVDFTEEELKRFRKAANFNMELNQLNGNMTTISDDFIRQQQRVSLEDHSSTQSVFFDMSPEPVEKAPLRETYQLSDEKDLSARANPEIDILVEWQIEMLGWELATEIIQRPIVSDKFLDRSHLVRPAPVSDEERNRFLNILNENLPDELTLHRKLNQKITPTPSEILRCMRLDFSEDDFEEEDECYEEISKYEFVISQEICVKSVTLFKNELDDKERQIIEAERQKSHLLPLQQILQRCPFRQRLEKFLEHRERFLTNRKQHTRDLRWEVLNIELHCVFDSWNEEIIRIRSTKSGFSGIGLNELTLCMIDHNKPIPVQKCEGIMAESREVVEGILSDDMELNAKILKQNFEQMCDNDSAWVFYADEALSYGLELVYLVEEEIYSELAKELRKISLRGWL